MLRTVVSTRACNITLICRCDASDSEVDRELEAQPERSRAQKNKKDSGEARRDRHDKNTWHAKKSKRHTVMRGVCAAGLEAGAVVASEVVEARVVTQIEAWVEACSMRALLGSLLLGLMVRGWFTRVRVVPDGQEVFEEIPAEDAVIPDLAERNMYLQLCRGLPPPGRRSRPSAAVEDVLAFYPGLLARLIAVPRYEHDSNTVDDVGTKLETNFANSLTVLFLCRVEQGVSLAGARVIAGSHEHQRRLWLPVDGSPAWTERQRSWVARSVQGKEVTWLEGQEQGQGGVVPTEAMRDEVARQRRLLGVGQGVVVNDAWLERGCNRGSLLSHAVDTSRHLEAANVSWQADWAVWQAAGGQRNTRPYRPPSPFALTPGCSCKAHHIKLDTQALFGLMRTAGMLPADITSLPKFRSGVAGPKDSEVANRWNAFLPNLAAVRPNVGQNFAQAVHTDGTNMATVAHEERYPSGAVKSVWQRSLTAGQYYRESGITEHAKESKAWMAGIKPQQDELSQVSKYTAWLQRYREYAATTLSTWPAMWAVQAALVQRQLPAGAAGFSGSGSIGSKGVPVKQMRWEACKQFPERVVLVHGFRTNRVSSARTNVVQGQAESFRWLYPVRSMAKRSRIRGLMRSTSTVIKRKFYDRDVTASAVRAVTIALPTATRYKYEQWRTCGLLQIIPSRAYSSEPASSQGAPASAADSPATTSVAIPSASPLQSLGKTVAQLTQSSPGQQYRKHLRPWRWYDDWDERQWQKQEILKQWDGSGYAHLKSIPHSMKKVDRILRLVRGLSYEEAMHQCRVRPHKAARYTQQVLEHAKRDAESKGISGSTLVVGAAGLPSSIAPQQPSSTASRSASQFGRSSTASLLSSPAAQPRVQHRSLGVAAQHRSSAAQQHSLASSHPLTMDSSLTAAIAQVASTRSGGWLTRRLTKEPFTMEVVWAMQVGATARHLVQSQLLHAAAADFVAGFAEACATEVRLYALQHGSALVSLESHLQPDQPHHALHILHDHASAQGRLLHSSLLAQSVWEVQYLGRVVSVPMTPLPSLPPPGAVKVVLSLHYQQAARRGITAAVLAAAGYSASEYSGEGLPAVLHPTSTFVFNERLGDHPRYSYLAGTQCGNGGVVEAWVFPPAGDPSLAFLPRSVQNPMGRWGRIQVFREDGAPLQQGAEGPAGPQPPPPPPPDPPSAPPPSPLPPCSPSPPAQPTLQHAPADGPMADASGATSASLHAGEAASPTLLTQASVEGLPGWTCFVPSTTSQPPPGTGAAAGLLARKGTEGLGASAPQLPGRRQQQQVHPLPPDTTDVATPTQPAPVGGSTAVVLEGMQPKGSLLLPFVSVEGVAAPRPATPAAPPTQLTPAVGGPAVCMAGIQAERAQLLQPLPDKGVMGPAPATPAAPPTQLTPAVGGPAVCVAGIQPERAQLLQPLPDKGVMGPAPATPAAPPTQLTPAVGGPAVCVAGIQPERAQLLQPLPDKGVMGPAPATPAAPPTQLTPAVGGPAVCVAGIQPERAQLLQPLPDKGVMGPAPATPAAPPTQLTPAVGGPAVCVAGIQPERAQLLQPLPDKGVMGPAPATPAAPPTQLTPAVGGPAVCVAGIQPERAQLLQPLPDKGVMGPAPATPAAPPTHLTPAVGGPAVCVAGIQPERAQLLQPLPDKGVMGPAPATPAAPLTQLTPAVSGTAGFAAAMLLPLPVATSEDDSPAGGTKVIHPATASAKPQQLQALAPGPIFKPSRFDSSWGPSRSLTTQRTPNTDLCTDHPPVRSSQSPLGPPALPFMTTSSQHAPAGGGMAGYEGGKGGQGSQAREQLVGQAGQVSPSAPVTATPTQLAPAGGGMAGDEGGKGGQGSQAWQQLVGQAGQGSPSASVTATPTQLAPAKGGMAGYEGGKGGQGSQAREQLVGQAGQGSPSAPVMATPTQLAPAGDGMAGYEGGKEFKGVLAQQQQRANLFPRVHAPLAFVPRTVGKETCAFTRLGRRASQWVEERAGAASCTAARVLAGTEQLAMVPAVGFSVVAGTATPVDMDVARLPPSPSNVLSSPTLRPSLGGPPTQRPIVKGTAVLRMERFVRGAARTLQDLVDRARRPRDPCQLAHGAGTTQPTPAPLPAHLCPPLMAISPPTEAPQMVRYGVMDCDGSEDSDLPISPPRVRYGVLSVLESEDGSMGPEQHARQAGQRRYPSPLMPGACSAAGQGAAGGLRRDATPTPSSSGLARSVQITRSPRGGPPSLAMQRPGVAASFQAVTLNVRGLAQPQKLQALLDWAASSTAQLFFLQECHQAECLWQWAEAATGAKPGWRGQWFYSPGTGHSQGCLVLVKPSTILQGCTQVQLQVDGAQGRVVRVDAELAGRPASLVCVYAPAQPAQRAAFFGASLPACLPHATERRMLFLGGDFNCILSPDDKVGTPVGATSQHAEDWVGSRGVGAEQLERLVEERGLYVSASVAEWQLDSSIQGLKPVSTDHFPVSVVMYPPDLPLTARAPWQLHPAHLDNPALLDGLAGFLSLEAAHHAAQLASSQGPQRRDVHRARWAHVKQGLALYAQRSLRAQRREQRDLEHRREKAATAARAHVVSQLRRAGQPGDADLRAAVQLGEVAALAGVQDREQGALRSMQASAVLDQCYGDRSSFYFYHRDQPAHTPTLISSLQLPTQPGQVADLSSPAGVLAACRVFEQHFSASSPTGVYAAKPVDPAARATLLASLTSRLTPAQANSCEGPGTDPMLSAEELGHALQGCAHSKAPGKDGLPMEVYDRLWPQLVGPLRAMLREALADTTDPAPLAEFLTGIITLVPKAGKPRDQVAGYRPITLLNCDVRLVARALEDRLQQPLDLLVSLSQSAFILGRDISDNVQFHLSLLEYLQQRGSPAWLLLLDLAGAYDNVSWGLLQDTMEAMGFRRDGHVRWAQLLHRGASSQVLVNGRLTDSFPLASGLLQGSGASPLYWCIALQPLVSYLSSLQLAGRINTPTIPHSPLSMCQPTLLPVLPSKEYADDLTIAVLDRVRDGAVVLEALGLFRAAGGPALSVAKSSALSCGQPVEVLAAGQEGGRAGAGSQRGEGNAGAASTGEGRVTGWVGGREEGGTGAGRAQRDKSGTVSLERGRGTRAGHGRGAGSSKDEGGERLDEGGGGQEHQQHRSLRQVPPSSTVAANPTQLASAGGGRTEVEGGGGGAGGEGVARSRGRGRGKGGAERGGQVWEGQGAGEGEGGAGPGTGAGAVTIPPSPQGVPVRHLGVPLGAASYSAMSEAAFGRAAAVMVAASLPWQGLNLLGRVQVAQQCLASKAIYQMAFVQPLAAAGVAMGKAVKRFVAASDLPQERSPNMACLYPNDASCVMSRREGGLGLPDLEITSTAMLAKTVAQLFSPRVREWQPLLNSLLADPQHSLSTWVVTDPTASPVPNLSPRLQAHVTAIAQLKLHRVVAPAAQSHFSVLAEPLRFNALVRLRGRPDSDPLAVEALRWTHVRHVREALHRPRSAFVSAEQQAAVRWEADMARATLPEPWQQVVDVRQLPAPEWECAWGGTGFLVRRVPSQRPTHWVSPSGRLVALDAQGQGPLGAVGVLPGEEWQAAAVVLLDKPHYRLSLEESAAHMRPLPEQRGGAAAPAALEPRLDPQVWGMGNTSLLVLTVKAARLRLTQLQRARFDPTYPASGGLWPALWGPRPPPGAEPPQGLAVTGAGLRTLEQRWLDSATLLAAQRAAGEREQQGRDVEELLPEEVQGSQTPRWRATNARPPPRPTPELRAVQRAQRQLDAQFRPGRGGRHSGNRRAGALPAAGHGALDGMVDELARSAQAGQPCLEVWQELLDPTLRREHVIVAWRVLHGSLMVGAMWGHILKEAAAPASSVCRLCQLGPLETLTHAFLTCPSVAPAWEWVLDVYERLTGTRPPSSDALLLLSGRPTHSEDGPFHPPDAHLWLRLRVAYLGSVWRLRCLGPAAALQTQSLAHRVAQGVIFTLSSAVQRDWYRVGRDIRVGLGGAVPSTWFKGRDPRLDERQFASLWPAASGGWFQRQQGELVVRLSLQWPVPAPPILGAAAEPG
ncbi:hypothetical protein QJQ45_012924 [Haematococcus lacustris]|nr:hypothetical protein QJQ45_012924 [Haematococcus lacustris]